MNNVSNENKKTALVIGGSGGIGASVVECLSNFCKKIYVHGGHDSAKFDELVKKINLSKKNYCDIEKLVYDFYMHEFDDMESSKLSKIAESVDILCVCHGPFLQKSIDKMSISDWSKIALYDYALPGFFVSKVLPNMMKNRFGRIILFGGTGTSHRTEFKSNSAYAGAKTAIGTLVESTAAAYSNYGITCNAILPGFVVTEYNSDFNIPNGMEISLDMIKKSICFFIENSELNGVLLRVDKGWSPLFAK